MIQKILKYKQAKESFQIFAKRSANWSQTKKIVKIFVKPYHHLLSQTIISIWSLIYIT